VVSFCGCGLGWTAGAKVQNGVEDEAERLHLDRFGELLFSPYPPPESGNLIREIRLQSQVWRVTLTPGPFENSQYQSLRFNTWNSRKEWPWRPLTSRFLCYLSLRFNPAMLTWTKGLNVRKPHPKTASVLPLHFAMAVQADIGDVGALGLQPVDYGNGAIAAGSGKRWRDTEVPLVPVGAASTSCLCGGGWLRTGGELSPALGQFIRHLDGHALIDRVAGQ